MDTKGSGTPTEIAHELDASTKHQQIKEFRGFEKCYHELTEKTTKGKFVFNNGILSSQEFLFTFCLRSPYNTLPEFWNKICQLLRLEDEEYPP